MVSVAEGGDILAVEAVENVDAVYMICSGQRFGDCGSMGSIEKKWGRGPV